MSKKNALILMSGGLDSYACAHFMLSEGFDVTGLFIDHGQLAASQEDLALKKISSYLNIPINKIYIRGGPKFGTGELIGRNSFLIDAALFLAKPLPGIIAIGIHAGTSYYDCSSNFFEKVNDLIGEQTNGQIRIFAPFLEWTKRDIFEYIKLSKLNIALTYSCEKGVVDGCNECASCADRKALNAS